MLVWDYDHDTWWYWTFNNHPHLWMATYNVNGDEVLYFADNQGGIFRFDTGQLDHGDTIAPFVQTQRLFYHEVGDEKRRLRYVRVTGTNEMTDILVAPYVNDETSATAGAIDLTDPNETSIIPRRRVRRIDFMRDFDWVQLVFTHLRRNQKMQLGPVHVGTEVLGVR